MHLSWRITLLAATGTPAASETFLQLRAAWEGVQERLGLHHLQGNEHPNNTPKHHRTKVGWPGMTRSPLNRVPGTPPLADVRSPHPCKSGVFRASRVSNGLKQRGGEGTGFWKGGEGHLEFLFSGVRQACQATHGLPYLCC